jgi:putative ATP-dependent endonuclease of the OLD family
LSFKYCKDLADSVDYNNVIFFNEDESGDNLYILIGPNGSGKSNFIEILNQIFKKNLFLECKFDMDVFKRDLKNGNKVHQKVQILSGNMNGTNYPKTRYLDKNYQSQDKEQKIIIGIILNEQDKKNIEGIKKNKEVIISSLKEYADIPLEKIIANEKIDEKIQLVFSRNNLQEDFKLGQENGSKDGELLYLQYFNVLNAVIEINKIKDPEFSLDVLKETFVIFGCYRSNDNISEIYCLATKSTPTAKQEEQESINRENTKETGSNREGEHYIFGKVKYKLAREFKIIALNEKKPGEFTGEQFAERELSEREPLKSINAALKEFLKIELKVKLDNLNDNTFQFSFLNIDHEDKRKRNFFEFSAGEKAIILLIFLLYGADVENGLMLIDEPELHLHPQFQKKYLEILQEESKKRKIQFIISTHSPVFVTEKTIGNVKRFSYHKNTQSTKVICYDNKAKKSEAEDKKKSDQTAKDKDLVRILHYTNNAKIFFVNKIILVEGVTDAYFFSFYIDNYFKENSNIDLDSYEILDIGGKGSYDIWKRFLESWELEVYYIGDWDNVEQFIESTGKIIKNAKEKIKGKIHKKINDNLTEKNSLDGKTLIEALYIYIVDPDPNSISFRNLVKLADYLLVRHTPWKEIIKVLAQEEKEVINKQIEEQYKKNIFIFKQGELEDYLGIEKKGIDKVVDFCENFPENRCNWEVDKRKEKKEIDGIFKKIFHSNDD